MQLSEIFYWLLSMSATAVICSVVIMLIGRISIIPKSFIKHLWLIPFLRLCIPVGLPWKYGLMELTAKLTKSVTVPVSFADLKFYAMNHVVLAEKYVPFTFKTDIVRKIFEIGSIVWLSCAILILIFIFALYADSVTAYRDAKHFRGKIYFSENADSPFLLGIIKPKIILPTTLYGKDNGYIISHELCHMKSLDNLSRLLAFCICAIHWFNPFVWIFLKIYLRDMELACDEKVIKNYDDTQKKAYALTLVESKKEMNSLISGFGSSGLARRIRGILSYRRISVFSAFFLILFFVFIGYVLLSNGSAG